MDFFDLITQEEKDEEGNTQSIDEGLVDVVFKTFRTNMKTSVAGSLIYFKWEWVNTKTFFTVRVKRSTLQGLVDWLNNIMDEANGSKED